MDNLKQKPFNLNDDDIKWVKDTLSSMSEQDKISQLFCLIAYVPDPEYLVNLSKNVKPGGLMLRPMSKDEGTEVVSILQKNSAIPMLPRIRCSKRLWTS